MDAFRQAIAKRLEAREELTEHTGTSSIERYEALMRHVNGFRLECEK